MNTRKPTEFRKIRPAFTFDHKDEAPNRPVLRPGQEAEDIHEFFARLGVPPVELDTRRPGLSANAWRGISIALFFMGALALGLALAIRFSH